MRTRLPILLFAVVAFFQASALSAQSTPLPRTYAFGTSCGGATSGSAQISIDPTTVADAGDLLKVKLTGAPANTSVALNLSHKIKPVTPGVTVTPLKRLKLAPSCTAYVSPQVGTSGLSIWTTTNGNGEAEIELAIPDYQSFVGTRFNMQWVISAPTSGRIQSMTASDAISTVAEREVELRNVIGATNASTNGRILVGMYNTFPYSSSVYYSVPVPLQTNRPVRIKRIRFIGGAPSLSAPLSAGTADVSVWPTLQSAISSPTFGTLYQGWIPAPISSANWGTSSYNLPTYNFTYNTLASLSALVLQPGTQYYLGLSVEAGGGFGGPGISDTLSPSCAQNTLVSPFYPNGLPIQGGAVSSGCVAMDVYASVS